MRYKATVIYDGTNYCGWQIQDDKPTVQQEIEKALKTLFGKDTSIVGSGRTDSGVHALGQVFSFESDTTIPEKRLYKAINAHLPCDIRVTECVSASPDFNARYSAKRKTYTYHLYCSETENPLKERYSVKCFPLDIALMKKAGILLVGEHDFKCFCASGSSVKTTVRTIYDIEIIKTEIGVDISVTGNGFLYNMIRTLVGTLIKMEKGDLTVEKAKEILSSGNRKLVGKTYPAKGLKLKSVIYC